jgi:DNA-binding Lrp family transcriptional regulator
MSPRSTNSIAGVLSPVQQAIIGFLSTQEAVSLEELAKTLNIKTHTARYHLNQLVQEGNIKKSIRLSSDRLGATVFNFFFNLPGRRSVAALEFLKSHRMVSWLAENSWERRYEMTIFTRHHRDIMTLFEELGDTCGTNIQDCMMCMEADVSYYGMKSLLPPNSRSNARKYNESADPISLDLQDYQVLRCYVTQPTDGTAGIAKALGMSSSTCAYRLERLRRLKVISWEGYFSFERRDKIAEAQLLLQAKSLAQDVRSRIEEVAMKHPYVEGLIRCQGDWDYKFLLYAEDLQSLLNTEESVRDLLGKDVLSTHFVIRRKRLIPWQLPAILA